MPAGSWPKDETSSPYLIMIDVEEIASKFVAATSEWMKWTKDNFPRSGAKSSLIHLQEEIKEVLEAIDDPASYTHHEGITLMEFADCMICLLTASGKSGFTILQLFKAIMNKMQTNYKRTWRLNPDDTYSHVKTKDPLEYDLCPGCGEIHPAGEGYLAALQHHCALNTVTYRRGSFKLADLESIFGGRKPLQSFYDLLQYPHLKKMHNFETASVTERNIYRIIREAEVAAMKRMRAYIELEEDLYAKY